MAMKMLSKKARLLDGFVMDHFEEQQAAHLPLYRQLCEPFEGPPGRPGIASVVYQANLLPVVHDVHVLSPMCLS